MPGSARDPETILRRIEWTVIRRLDGLLHGDHRTLFRGFGLDLADLREYQLHDDVRHIDWNVTARMQAPYVREYHEDREITTWFLLDVSPSVDFGSGEVEKAGVLVDLVAVLARLLARNGGRNGAILYADGVGRTVHPRPGRVQVLRILDHLLRRPRLERSAPTDLGAFLRAAAQTIPRRSLVFVVSDFMSRPGWGEALLRLSRRHETLAVRLLDPLERHLPDLGLVVMQDAETGEQLLVDTHDEGFRERFAATVRSREATLRKTFVHAGVDALELATDDDLGDAVLRFAELRRSRARLAARGVLPRHLEARST